MLRSRIPRWPEWAIAAFTLAAGFGTYFSMYAFRKPFTAARFEDADLVWGSIDFKIAIIVAQVLGYALSKFIGIKVIAELRARQRFALLLGLMGAAWLALAGFGMAGGSAWSLLWLFLNGLPLGMIWGIVFSYMEGRRLSELLGAGLCASFIVSSGAVKSAGAWLMQSWGLSAYWMPFATGALFLPLLVLCAWMLEQIPPPSPADIALRTQRAPMNGHERAVFFRTFAPGLLALVACYILVTILRDFRDNFAAEIWNALGYDNAAIFTTAELPIAALILVMLALTMFIRDNARAFLLYHVLMLGGCLLIGGATYAFQSGVLRGDYWMMTIGAGLYIIYVPFNAILFDRMIAAFQHVATAGFLIYVADASGYLGSVAALLFKNFGQPDISWLDFFVALSYGIAAVSGFALALAWAYFRHKLRTQHLPTPAAREVSSI